MSVLSPVTKYTEVNKYFLLLTKYNFPVYFYFVTFQQYKRYKYSSILQTIRDLQYGPCYDLYTVELGRLSSIYSIVRYRFLSLEWGLELRAKREYRIFLRFRC